MLPSFQRSQEEVKRTEVTAARLGAVTMQDVDDETLEGIHSALTHIFMGEMSLNELVTFRAGYRQKNNLPMDPETGELIVLGLIRAELSDGAS